MIEIFSFSIRFRYEIKRKSIFVNPKKYEKLKQSTKKINLSFFCCKLVLSERLKIF